MPTARDDEDASTVWGRRPIPAWFVRLSRLSWGFIGIGLAVVGVGLAVSSLRELVVPLVLASFGAVVCAPAVGWLERRRVPRALGSLVVLLLLLVAVWGAVVVVVVGVVDQVDELSVRFDEAEDELESWIEDSEFNELVESIRSNASDSASTVRDGFGSQVGTILDSATGFATGLVLGLVLLYYLLKDGADIAHRLMRGRNPQQAAQNERILAQAGDSIRGYFRAKTVLALAQGVFVGVVLAIMDVPLAGSVGLVNFIGAYIPFLGAFIGGAFAVLMALSDGGFALALAALAVVLVANLVLENVLEPRLLGSSLNMHPIVVLLATVGGGVVAGLVGLVLAAPLTAIGINLFRELKDSGFFDDGQQGVDAEPQVDGPVREQSEEA